MTAQLIDGNAIAKSIRADLATVIEGWRSADIDNLGWPSSWWVTIPLQSLR